MGVTGCDAGAPVRQLHVTAWVGVNAKPDDVHIGERFVAVQHTARISKLAFAPLDQFG